jgi:hypothetical protein
MSFREKEKKMHREKVAGMVGAILLLLLASPIVTEAATVEPMTLDQMAKRAEAIFIGKVVGRRADFNAQRNRIYTYVTLEVERYLKGGGGEREMTIRLWGGQVGPYTSYVPGTPQFTDGEEVLLFCSGSRARVPTLLGLSLGKFTITQNDVGERILKRDISGLVLANYRTDSRPAGAPPTRYRLSEVETRIQTALAN